MKTIRLLNEVTTLVTGVAAPFFDMSPNPTRTFQAYGTTTSGTGAATITVNVSHNGSDYMTLATIELPLSTVSASDGFLVDAHWEYVRAEVTAISGTGATVSLIMGG